MIREIKAYTVPLTRELAEEWATMPRWKGDRTIRPARREIIQSAIVNGEFHSPSWSVAWFDGKKFRMDGQASSTVLAESNGHFPVGLSASIREFACDTEMDLAELFTRFDRPTSSRNASECAASHGRLYPELSSLSDRRLSSIVSGIDLAMNEGKARPGSLTDRSRLIHHHREFAAWVIPILRARLFDRGSVTAAIFLTYRVSPEAAMQFWTLVRDESHPDNRNPTRVLAKFLEEVARPSNAAGSNKRTRWDTRAVIVKSVHAWNAWRQGKTTDLKYFPESPFPAAA